MLTDRQTFRHVRARKHYSTKTRLARRASDRGVTVNQHVTKEVPNEYVYQCYVQFKCLMVTTWYLYPGKSRDLTLLKRDPRTYTNMTEHIAPFAETIKRTYEQGIFKSLRTLGALEK